jgi:WD40 repeat protein
MNMGNKRRLITGHLIAFVAVILAPAAALSQGRPNIIWASGGHSDSINSVVYSNDGQLFASGSADRTIKLWRANGTFLRTLAIPYDSNAQLTDVVSVAFSPDSTLLGAGVELYNATSQTSFGAVQIWRISDGALVQNFTSYGAAVTSVAFSPDVQLIASGSADRSVKVWQIANGTLVSDRLDHTQRVNQVAFSPDGQRLASASDDRTAKLYRSPNWEVERTLTGHTDSVTSLAFSPNGATLATGGLDDMIRLWNVADGGLLFSLAHGSDVYAVAFAANGQKLASGGWGNTIKLWNPQSGLLNESLFGHTGPVLSLACAPDNRTLASSSWYPEYAIKLWREREGARPPLVTHHSRSIYELIFTTTHQLISAGDMTARFWNVSEGRFIGSINALTDVTTMALSPNGQLLALPGLKNVVNIYRTSDGALTQTLAGHTDRITGLAFSHDGSFLASGAFFNGSNDEIKVWNLATGTVVRELSSQFLFGPFTGINFSAGDTFIAAECEGVPAVWRVADGTFAQGFSVVGSAKFSPDGTLLVIGSNPISVYRTSDWMQVATLSDQNQAVAFTPNGQYLAIGGPSQIQFWRTSDWSLQHFYDQEMGPSGFGVTSLAFSTDGSQFAYGRFDALLAVATNPVNSPSVMPLGKRTLPDK